MLGALYLLSQYIYRILMILIFSTSNSHVILFAKCRSTIFLMVLFICSLLLPLLHRPKPNFGMADNFWFKTKNSFLTVPNPFGAHTLLPTLKKGGFEYFTVKLPRYAVNKILWVTECHFSVADLVCAGWTNHLRASIIPKSYYYLFIP